MKLLTIDDHARFRQGLKFLMMDLQSDPDFLEAESLAEALALDDKQSIEIILLDYHLRDSEADESLQKISAAFGNAMIVVLSGEEDPQLIRRLIDLGAAGYIPKSSTQDILIAALKLILAGGVYIPAIAFHATACADTQQQNPEHALNSLSKWQLEVLTRAGQVQQGHRARALHCRGDGQGASHGRFSCTRCLQPHRGRLCRLAAAAREGLIAGTLLRQRHHEEAEGRRGDLETEINVGTGIATFAALPRDDNV